MTFVVIELYIQFGVYQLVDNGSCFPVLLFPGSIGRGIGMLCMFCISVFRDGEALGVGVGEAIGFDPPADAGGSDLGVGEGIGIV